MFRIYPLYARSVSFSTANGISNNGKVSETDNLIYDSSLEVLHPGGWEKTDEMTRAYQIGP